MPRIQPQTTGSLNEQDRLELAKLLVKAGYSVKLGRERKPKASGYDYFVEYCGEGDTYGSPCNRGEI